MVNKFIEQYENMLSEAAAPKMDKKQKAIQNKATKLEAEIEVALDDIMWNKRKSNSSNPDPRSAKIDALKKALHDTHMEELDYLISLHKS